jgi:hypothetical protein
MNETFLFFLSETELWRKKFKCNRTIQLDVPGFVNYPHATFTDFFQDFVVGYGLADHDALRYWGTDFLDFPNMGKIPPEPGFLLILKREGICPVIIALLSVFPEVL